MDQDTPLDDLFDQAAEMLFQLGRSFTRMPLLPPDDAVAGGRTQVQVCLAIAGGSDTPEDVTVGWVASALGIEASTASRLVAQAVARRLVQSAPSPTDRRRLVLDLTAAGADLVRGAKRYQRQVFDELTHSWEPAERELFARLFLVFAADVIRRATVERAGDS